MLFRKINNKLERIDSGPSQILNMDYFTVDSNNKIIPKTEVPDYLNAVLTNTLVSAGKTQVSLNTQRGYYMFRTMQYLSSFQCAYVTLSASVNISTDITSNSPLIYQIGPNSSYSGGGNTLILGPFNQETPIWATSPGGWTTYCFFIPSKWI